MVDYSQHFRDTRHVAAYDEHVYGPATFDSHVSELEMRWLRAFCDRAFSTAPVQFDFACGTGRIIAGLQDKVRHAHGFDPSPEMLERARDRVPGADFVAISQFGPVAPPHVDLDAATPALVTMFRLLLNCDAAARDRALQFCAATLRQHGGYAIFDNHGSRSSLRQLAGLRHRRPTEGNTEGPWFHSLSHREVVGMADRNGLRIVERHGFAPLPPMTYRVPVVRGAARRLNTLTADRPGMSLVGTNIIYVATLA